MQQIRVSTGRWKEAPREQVCEHEIQASRLPFEHRRNCTSAHIVSYSRDILSGTRTRFNGLAPMGGMPSDAASDARVRVGLGTSTTDPD